MEQALREIDESWTPLIDEMTREVIHIEKVLHKRGKPYYPSNDILFRPFKLVPLPQVRVIIFNEEPYCNKGYDNLMRATGLAYDLRKEDRVTNSMRNIQKALHRDIKLNPASHGSLEKWTEQGILLLNACLTVDVDEEKSHKRLWQGFMREVITLVSSVNPHCIVVMWGEVQYLEEYCRELNMTILRYCSPSSPSFARCSHFSLINDMLTKQGDAPIDWSQD